jgi:hypothetical protein
MEDIMKIFTEVVSLIASSALNKRQFKLFLKEFDSVFDSMLKYSHICGWEENTVR